MYKSIKKKKKNILEEDCLVSDITLRPTTDCSFCSDKV